MDTVADFYLPDYLDPNAPMMRPEPGPPPAPGPPAPVPMAAPPLPLQPPEPHHQAYAPSLEEPPIDIRQYILAAIIGVGVAVAIGGVGLFVWHLISPDPPSAVSAPAQRPR
jgi:hypothetical protein